MRHKKRTRYGIVNFVWDVFMVCLTGGFWIIWILCRESRNLRA